MTTTERRRIISAAYRILHSVDSEQYRAFDRLCSLTTFAVALDTWLKTKPDPERISQVLDAEMHRMMLASPLRYLTPRQEAHP